MGGGGLYAYFWWPGEGVGKAPEYAYVIYEWSKRESHEKLHGEIMDILSIPEGNRFLSSILPAIVCLKDSLDQNEVDLYANAEAVLDS